MLSCFFLDQDVVCYPGLLLRFEYRRLRKPARARAWPGATRPRGPAGASDAGQVVSVAYSFQEPHHAMQIHGNAQSALPGLHRSVPAANVCCCWGLPWPVC